MRRLRATEWPNGRFEVVLVDNAPSDGVVDRARAEWPDLRVIESDRNLGFAGGCNLALRDLDEVDAVALVNSDVLVEPGWLAPLARWVTTRRSAPRARRSCSRRAREIELRSGTRRPGRGDGRRLGVRVSGARATGSDLWRDTQLVEGFWGPEHGPEPESGYQWTSGRAIVRVPVKEADPAGTCELRLAADGVTRGPRAPAAPRSSSRSGASPSGTPSRSTAARST